MNLQNTHYHFKLHAGTHTMAPYISVNDDRHWEAVGHGASEREAADRLIECKRDHGTIEGDESDMFEASRRTPTIKVGSWGDNG